MQAFFLHPKHRPTLRKGETVLPIAEFRSVAIPLSILRKANRKSERGRCDYLTLLHLPADHPVAVVVGMPRFKVSELAFYPLNALPPEDVGLMADSFQLLKGETLGSLVLDHIAQLVLGTPLGHSAIKWTKDLRLLERGAKNASTKRT